MAIPVSIPGFEDFRNPDVAKVVAGPARPRPGDRAYARGVRIVVAVCLVVAGIGAALLVRAGGADELALTVTAAGGQPGVVTVVAPAPAAVAERPCRPGDFLAGSLPGRIALSVPETLVGQVIDRLDSESRTEIATDEAGVPKVAGRVYARLALSLDDQLAGAAICLARALDAVSVLAARTVTGTTAPARLLEGVPVYEGDLVGVRVAAWPAGAGRLALLGSLGGGAPPGDEQLAAAIRDSLAG